MYGDPAFLVLDEPNSNLDDLGEIALIQAIADLKQRGKTVVLITHRRNSIALADKLLVLRDGSVEVFGPRDKVLEALQQAAQKAQQSAPYAGSVPGAGA
jgi:ATP-binding cassette subfamily C exporter for protease/lipase